MIKSKFSANFGFKVCSFARAHAAMTTVEKTIIISKLGQVARGCRTYDQRSEDLSVMFAKQSVLSLRTPHRVDPFCPATGDKRFVQK